ncbi:MAG: NBR1-Ig-like domain-containing protein [Chloroflexota bacterium]
MQKSRKEKMKSNNFISIIITIILLFVLSGCVTAPTPDASAISTSAAQTVIAQITAAAPAATETPIPPTETAEPKATNTPKPQVSPTFDPAQVTVVSGGKPCYSMTFLSDITIPDWMVIAPGAQFTKTWRVRNDGNCVWDPSYALVLSRGDGLGTLTRLPVSRTVNPGDTYDFSLDLVAPTTEGDYAGFWLVATPYGGFMGVAGTNQALSVKIKVSSKPDSSFNATNVTIDWTRRPVKGCTSKGAAYDFSATITVNGAGEIRYRWDRNPFDGSIVSGKLNFDAAGSKTVYWTWNFQQEAIQGIDRWAAITTEVDGKEKTFGKLLFMFTCAN